MREMPLLRKGRGALTNVSGRFESLKKSDFDDGWNTLIETERGRRTCWRSDTNRTIITKNHSPDLHFDRSINPYRGCEHGCSYCFARPSHTYLGHSAGLDFERLLYAKKDAASLLRAELSNPRYRCEPIAIGVNTDAYQPLERKLGITREILTVLAETKHPAYLITKSSLIERDIDLLAQMAEENLVTVCITITTLSNELSSKLEPRASAPHRRLRTVQKLSEAGISTGVSVSPIIPALNEEEIDSIVKAAADAGARRAHALLIRLPHELAQLFPEWLEEHYPLRAARIIKAIRSMRSDNLYRSEFGERMTGTGPRAEIIKRRFELACRRYGVSTERELTDSDCSLFTPPMPEGQLSLFG